MITSRDDCISSLILILKVEQRNAVPSLLERNDVFESYTGPAQSLIRAGSSFVLPIIPFFPTKSLSLHAGYNLINACSGGSNSEVQTRCAR